MSNEKDGLAPSREGLDGATALKPRDNAIPNSLAGAQKLMPKQPEQSSGQSPSKGSLSRSGGGGKRD